MKPTCPSCLVCESPFPAPFSSCQEFGPSRWLGAEASTGWMVEEIWEPLRIPPALDQRHCEAAHRAWPGVLVVGSLQSV